MVGLDFFIGDYMAKREIILEAADTKLNYKLINTVAPKCTKPGGGKWKSSNVKVTK